MLMNLNPSLQGKPRRSRSDSKHEKKFPVSSDDWMLLKKICRAAGYGNQQTRFNTQILIDALTEYRYRPDRFPELDYPSSSKTTMTVLPTQFFCDQIESIQLDLNILSERRVVHRLIMNMVKRRGEDLGIGT